MTVETRPVRQPTDVIVFRNLAPVKDLDSLSEESKRAVAEFRATMGVGTDVDLTGTWWGVIAFEPRRFQRCDSQQEAEALGLQLGRDIGSAVWLEGSGHPGAKLLATFR